LRVGSFCSDPVYAPFEAVVEAAVAVWNGCWFTPYTVTARATEEMARMQASPASESMARASERGLS